MARKGTMEWNLCDSDKPAERETTKNNFCGSFFRKSSPSLLSLLADIGKTTKTTSTTYNNAFDKSCAKPSSLEFCHGEKGYHGMEPV